MSDRKHVGPQAWERAPYELWDRLEAEARRGGNKAANALATKALQAIAPADRRHEGKAP